MTPRQPNKAREAFEDFIARYPGSEKIAQARENLERAQRPRSQRLPRVAKFYDKQKNFKAAVIYYNDVIKQQPNSPDAECGKEAHRGTQGQSRRRRAARWPRKAETGARAQERRRLQAQVDTAARSDFAGPPVSVPVTPDQVAPAKPKLRTSPQDVGPVPAVEPALPQQ